MKIVLNHTAQIVGSKGKVEQHPPGKKLDVDEVQAKRLIDAGYAKRDGGQEPEEESTSGLGGTGTGTGEGGSGGAGNPPGSPGSGTGGG